MKLTLKILLLLLSATCFGQLQRLSILPQQGIKITNGHPAHLKTLSIDYFGEIPTAASMSGQAAYNQVYLAENVVIMINGIKVSSTFQSLVQSDNPLLLLLPQSNLEVTASINPASPEGKKIKSVELTFKNPSEIGNISNNRDVTQAQIIFANWGYAINQEEYWRRAKCLDVMQANNLLTYGINFILSAPSKNSFDQLYFKMDFYTYSGSTFKNLVSNGYFVLDANLNFTSASIQQLEQAFYYVDAISKTRDINEHWKINYTNPGYDPADIEKLYTAKQLYYQQSKNLMPVIGNTAIRDTVINNARYVLMVAWKNGASFNALTKKDPVTQMITYTSDTTFFKYAFFMVTRLNMQQWLAKNNMSDWPAPAYNTRLMQLLGLPPGSTNNIFVEVWVSENDFFRPTIDPSLDASRLPYKPDPAYLKGFEGYSAGSFAGTNLLWKYPFTGLGYTWDYNPGNPTHFGLSEFVLYAGKTIYVRREVPTKEYLSSFNK